MTQLFSEFSPEHDRNAVIDRASKLQTFSGELPRLPFRDAIIETVVKVILTLKSESEPGSHGQINLAIG